MKTAIILPARDEGQEVADTIESVKTHVDQICVVDDASRDKSCDHLPKFVDVIRNGVAKGPAFCRNCAMLYDDFDCYIFSDAHVRVDEGSLRDFCALAIEKNAILNAAIRPLGGQRSWTGYGGCMVDNGDCIKLTYNMIQQEDCKRITGLIGAFYAIPRNIYRVMCGWPKTISWGYNEQALSMTAAFLGIPIYCDKTTVIRHKFKKRFNYPCHMSDTHVNRWIVHYLLFSEPTWRGYWQPIFAKKHSHKARNKARKELKNKELIAARQSMQAHKAIDDDQFFDILRTGGFSASRSRDGSS